MQANRLFGFLLFCFYPYLATGQKIKIIVFGDSQKIVNESPLDYLNGMQQLLTDPQTNDADFIFQMGDLIEVNQAENWKIVQQTWQRLNGKVSYVLNLVHNDVFRGPKTLESKLNSIPDFLTQ